MSLDLNQYESALKYGATIGASDLASGAITTAKVATSAITGAKLSLGNSYAIYAAQTTGNVAVSVFPLGTTTAPSAGTVIGFFAVNNGTGAVTSALWGTTAGTIATIGQSGTSGMLGFVSGTSVLNASVASGDTLQVSSTANTGTSTCFVVFQAI